MEVLRQYFGFSSFREGQQTLIDAVLAGRDVLGVMPTGGGKSLCYELPALLLPGLTLVISPLISLMKDQVMALQNAGIPAGCIHSAMSVEELREAYRDTRFGAYKILYIAPERLLTDGFCALAQELEISLLAVDEAHCISQWGQDFRPSYLKILDFLQKLPRRPALAAFTATATAQVRSDIVRILQLQDPVTVVTGFDRPNLRFEVLRPQDKRRALLELLEERRDKSGIVYCATRKGVEQICELLQSSGFAASRYHAGLSPDERRQNQEDFICDRCTVMVATNAFGMGIDKSNVSYVIHCNMPKSVEAYYQEAGRAGRDGAPADCILLFSPGDITTAKYLILNQTENDELTDEERQTVQAQDLIRLEQMTGYCKTTGCLRGYLLDYFGQPHAPRCENCGNCQAEYDLQDLTREAQMILSCVVRVRTRLGYCVGTALLGQVLRGSRAARVRELGLEDLPTYGLMRDLPAGRIRELLELLEAGGYLQTDPVHGGVDTTPQAAEVLFHGQRVEVSVKRQPLQDQPARGRAKAKAERPKKAEDDLLAALKALRLRLSQEQHIPAYIICTNATLLDMAARRPRTIEELLEVSGIGQAKAERFGDAFLKELEHYEQTHGRNAPRTSAVLPPRTPTLLSACPSLPPASPPARSTIRPLWRRWSKIRRGRISCAAASRCTSMSPVRTTGPSSAAPPSAARTGTIRRRAACIPSSCCRKSRIAASAAR